VSIESLVLSLSRLADSGTSEAEGTFRARGALARLRRAILSAHAAVEAYRYIAPHMPANESPSDYLLIGSIFGLNPRHQGDRSRNLGKVCAELGRQEDGSASLAADRRFTAMLSSRRSDLVPHLRRVATMADRQGLAIDYVGLFYDLRRWDNEAMTSQLAWARSFYPMKAEEPPPEPGDQDISTQAE